jgi:hypothetical protein
MGTDLVLDILSNSLSLSLANMLNEGSQVGRQSKRIRWRLCGLGAELG